MLRYLLALATIALCTAAQPPTGQAASAQILKFGYILAPNSQLGAGYRVFADEVARRTDGRYRIEQYPNAQLGGEIAMIKGVQLGTIDIAYISGAAVANVVPQVGIFGIPFLIRDAAHAHAVLDGPFGRDLLAKFAGQGVVALAWGANGMHHLTNSRRPVAGPEDLRDLKLGVPQNETIEKGFRALGANARQLAFPELYGALQAGWFDSQENPIATIVAARFAQVQSHLSLTGHIYDPAVFLMSRDAFADLPEADRAAFADAARLGGLASRDFAARAETSGVELLQNNGMKVAPAIDRERFVQAMTPVMPIFEAQFGDAAIALVRAQQVARQ